MKTLVVNVKNWCANTSRARKYNPGIFFGKKTITDMLYEQLPNSFQRACTMNIRDADMYLIDQIESVSDKLKGARRRCELRKLLKKINVCIVFKNVKKHSLPANLL
jgi:hypothetical protein